MLYSNRPIQIGLPRIKIRLNQNRIIYDDSQDIPKTNQNKPSIESQELSPAGKKLIQRQEYIINYFEQLDRSRRIGLSRT